MVAHVRTGRSEMQDHTSPVVTVPLAQPIVDRFEDQNPYAEMARIALNERHTGLAQVYATLAVAFQKWRSTP
jgi:hypothetical protein